MKTITLIWGFKLWAAGANWGIEHQFENKWELEMDELLGLADSIEAAEELVKNNMDAFMGDGLYIENILIEEVPYNQFIAGNGYRACKRSGYTYVVDHDTVRENDTGPWTNIYTNFRKVYRMKDYKLLKLKEKH